MDSTKTFVLSFLSFLCCSHSIVLRPYSHHNHPLFELNDTLKPNYVSSALNPTPVVVEKYYLYPDSENPTTSGAFFFPHAANYETFSSTTFLSSADVLYLPSGQRKTSDFAKIHIHHPARVSLLLSGPSIKRKVLTALLNVRGPPGWKVTTAVRRITGTSAVLGDPDRHGKIKLPFQGVLVERLVEEEKSFTLPHPGFFTVNGKPVTRIAVIFSQITSLEKEPKSFPYPEIPDKLTLPITGKRLTPELVAPNVACPAWLHDIHVTESREDKEVTNSLQDLPYWRTWHPQVDPIYWCYFGHEHGAFPGPHRPMFGYTAWKTYDPNTYMQRQDESHQGFKVFSFPIEDQEKLEANKFVVIVVHMHLAFARRFTTRFHTVSFAVWGGDDAGRLEAEFHMKMDFGAALVPLPDQTNRPLDASQETILKELLRAKKVAGRRFNVLNIDDKYPDSVDTQFGFNKGMIPDKKNKKKVMRGLYEQWEGPLNTCSGSSKNRNSGFRFDVKDPGTAIRFLNDTTDETIQKLLGNSLNRFMVIKSVVSVGINDCCFDVFSSDGGVNLELNDGVFYTDPFFRSILQGAGKYSVRQYIMPEWPGVVFPKGTIQNIDEWSAWMRYSEKPMSSLNIEGAVDGNMN